MQRLIERATDFREIRIILKSEQVIKNINILSKERVEELRRILLLAIQYI